ncbi:5-methyltetrahydropteroyltriglutamate--homocysteine S-methyltransferase [Bacillus sp. AFS041924]|uniref:5-methyltetrahydropteroyltriglutamate-- homocysteine S-methyltransferase n=1 Tax=Bacillus sp. AFS041924 TaxID=2033503 RepID=UPI000BFC79BF|nr:5-methyltetrahydropteroyltriglutamate--homocysteine S-methyltransferase [Bacillus sp. AFS041924]PGS56822.1 5-methyltetrahydropteroyltriglutamate--homocysteine S-methyltransferase [Bacillus sp. AFS041924]
MVHISNLGYPRIGENREWKKTLESFWQKKINQEEFEKEMKSLRLRSIQKQHDLGVELIPVNDFTYYDHVLDFATMFGWIPSRFGDSNERPSLETYFALARGSKNVVACEMTKWFNTNYHYIVPEYNKDKPSRLLFNKPLEAYKEAFTELGIKTKPVILGIYTFVQLAKGYQKEEKRNIISKLLPVYIQLLKQLENEGVEWVQIDEPCFVLEETSEEISFIKEVYEEITKAVPSLSIMLQTYFESVEQYKELITFPVEGIGLDFVHGKVGNLQSINKYGFPNEKVLGVGIINGRNIWRNDLTESINLLNSLKALIKPKDWWIQPSSSLLHVPVTKIEEDSLNETLFEALSFADEKLEELVLLKNLLINKENLFENEVEYVNNCLVNLKQLSEKNHSISELESVNEDDFSRQVPFQLRYPLQNKVLNLPILPTTTIGSFPQTKEIKQIRQQWRKGNIDDSEYMDQIKLKIKQWIEIQENIDMDVLVHGEYERTDMVEYFGEKLEGFAFTKKAWVQSYGSRCVKPPIIYRRVEFTKPITVNETEYAQSLTSKPVKGMLTGPVTILNWSFVREDLTKEEVANEIALALRKEVKALESAGISIIQVDEPAIREGLPLKRRDWDQYLNWVTRAFRLTTSSVRNETQIHTHMCYSNFSDIMEAIIELDADVISIEHARSHQGFSTFLSESPYPFGIGLGVYDIHSPRVPSIEEMEENILSSLKVCDTNRFWVNPDCGLKTRNETEVIDALSNMVKSAKKVREKFYSII